MRRRSILLSSFVSFAFLSSPAFAQQAAPRPKTILAIGAHAGDMELTAGAVLVSEEKKGNRAVLLHLTPGEKGNPKLSAEAYGRQKKQEAEAVAAAWGAEVVFGPWKDAELQDDEATKRWVAGVIRRVKPDMVIAHWRESMHRDHSAAHRIANDAILLAALDVEAVEGEPWRGVRSIWYAENWEDKPGFEPYVFVDVSASLDAWREGVSNYEFARGIISGFPYIDYYTALATVRGAEAWKGKAVAFAVEEHAKKRVVDGVP